MSPQNILFVDDDRLVLNALRRMLRSLRSEWKLSFAASAAEALEILGRNPVEIVVADMGMPDMTGIELLNRINDRHPEITRVMMTGQADYDIYRNGMEIAQYFLWKPVASPAMETLLQLLSNREVSLRMKN